MLVQKLTQAGFHVDARFTEYPGHATELARMAADNGYDGVLACGGDGTVNEVARAVAGTPLPLGIIPAGSGNGLARHMALPMDAMACADVIAARHIQDCDYGMVDGNPFFCTFGVGFDAQVSDTFAHAGQRGLSTYVRSAFSQFMSYHPELYRIEADGTTICESAYIVAVCNANQYGNNAYIAPHASITDGMLDLVVIPRMPKAHIATLGIDLMCGSLNEHRGIIQRKVKHVRIHRDQPGPAHRDGEPLSLGTDMEVTCMPGKLKMFTNPDKQGFRPLITPVEAMIAGISDTLRKLF